MKKLNIGCGKRPLEGYINLDIEPLEGVDIIADARNLNMISNNTYDEVYSYGFIEHVEPEYTKQVLKEMYRVLKPDGKIIIGTEDFEHQVKRYLEMGINGWTLSAVYGPHYSHRALFDESTLKEGMIKAGFKNIKNVGTTIGVLVLEGKKQ